jgi:peptidyl-prolyl cis-trans isomerase D
MFDLIRRNARLRYAMLAVVAVPLSFVGGEFLVGSQEAAISVGSSEIDHSRFDREIQRMYDDLRGRGVDVDNLSDELRRLAVSNLINETVSFLLQEESIKRKNLIATDEEVRKAIARTEDFQDESGVFSPDVFSALVADEHEFILEIRKQISRQRFFDWFRVGGIVSERSLSWYAAFLLQDRSVSHAEYPLDEFKSAVAVSDAEVQGYYSENLEDYVESERGRAHYFRLDLADFAKNMEVEEEEIELAYEDLLAATQENKSVRVGHILIESGDGAEELAAQIARDAQADPEAFAELAAKHSQDAGSAQIGGDLGFISRGDFDPALEDAMFALGVDEVSDPVESSFGLHVLKVTDMRSEAPEGSLEQMRDELAERIRREKAEEEFVQIVDEINERLYLEVDRLNIVAAEYGLQIEETDWLDPAASTEAGGEADSSPFDAPEILGTLFSPAHREGENTELMPTGEDAFIAARMAEYFPPRQKPFEEVAEEVREQVVLAQATRLAIDKISEDAENLREGKSLPLAWSETETFNLVEPSESGTYTDVDLEAIRRLDTTEGLPAYTYTPSEDAIRLIRVESIDTVPPDEATLEATRRVLLDVRGHIERLGYLEALVEEVPVVINVET